MTSRLLVLSLFAVATMGAADATREQQATPAARGIPLAIERNQAGAPITLGVPFPKDALESPDRVRVVNEAGREVASQVTEVTTWEPTSRSIKWVWVFFFAEASPRYFVEYGPTVRRARLTTRLEFINQTRDNGLAEINTGPLRIVVRQGEGGFISAAYLDLDRNGIDDGDLLATGQPARGTFADLLDDAGIDSSKATVDRTFIDKGSGPLHAILRVEGEYAYGRGDNNKAPFVTRIHAYAGKSYLRVLHTFVYTGVPDKHRRQEGDYPHVATQGAKLIVTDPTDKGWTIPEDRLNSLGLGLVLKLDGNLQARNSVLTVPWFVPGPAGLAPSSVPALNQVSLFQLGPKPDRIPPVPTSNPTTRLTGFKAVLKANGAEGSGERTDGWLDVFDSRRGVAFGLKNFVEEYPKEIRFDPATGQFNAFFWTPEAGPMSFARLNNEPAQENATENWAQGIAKTSEMLVYFHGRQTDDVAQTMKLVHAPPVAHLAPVWYGTSGVYGDFAPRTNHFPDIERAVDYKFDWMLFNQKWQPWYGLFEYGDMMNLFNGESWNTFSNGEPAQDYMWWLQFMRTGDPKVFDAALAFSRHLMDVDNTHWPTGPKYLGDSNYPMDWWTTSKEPQGTKYLGIGRRHAPQHWMHILSAHAWVQGWIASYYLAGEQRGLDVARMTADLHLRRLFGEHELTGRRLYLSVWNLSEVYDATKDPRYKRELEDRVERMLRLQPEQYDSIVLDRFGYTNVYASQGLSRYLEITGNADVRAALVRHARAVRDNPPLNHWMESYLSSIHSLTLGYKLTGDSSFVEEMLKRLEPLKVDALPRPIDDSWTQKDLFEALEKANHFPMDPNRIRPGANSVMMANPPPRRPIWAFTNGLRVFGWTSIYTVPYALAILEEQVKTSKSEIKKHPQE